LLTTTAQSLQYGSKTQNLSISIDPFHHELFKSTYSDSDSQSSSDDEDMSSRKPNPAKGVIKVPQTLNTSFLSMFGKNALAIAKKSLPSTTTKPAAAATKPAAATARTDDDAVASLKSQLASEKAKKDEKT
jgi:hypothetical protein